MRCLCSKQKDLCYFSLVGLQKSLHKGIEVEEKKLWEEEALVFNIYIAKL